MAGWFVDQIMEKLSNACSEYLKDQLRWQTGMKEELERLRENYPKIKAVVFASSKEDIGDQNPPLNQWLWRLRDAIDEADDVIDELEYVKLQKQLTKNTKKRKVRSVMKSIKNRFTKIAKRALEIDHCLKKLEEVVHKLDKVSADAAIFLHLVKDAKQEQQEQHLELYRARETGSLPKNDQVGRGKEREFIMQWLRNPSTESQTTLYNNISLLSIVGLGGMGKTNLLQHVYKYVMTTDFDIKMWVCVSINFDVKRVIADMLESLGNERPSFNTLDGLQSCLDSKVKSKKFLLVLDDICEDEQDKNKWENVLAPLASGSLGSKILVTTRMESVALMIAKVIYKEKEILILEGLKEDENLQLLNRYAFADVKNPDVHHNLRSIAEKIVKRLSGSPLAAKVIGGVLNSHLDERHWMRVLDYDIGSQNDILSILKLSYIFLSKVLQSCFSYCSIFPQDYMLDKDDLVQIWIALGFIQPPFTQGEALKDAGERYFDILVKKSLFDKFQNENRTYYKIHDLLHELIRSVSAQECFSVVADEKSLCRIPKTIRHLFVQLNDPGMLKTLWEFKDLRSLHLCFYGDYSNYVDALTKIFKTSRSIRFLYLSALFLERLPEEIGHLIHLRCLKIAVNNLTLLPRSLSNLYYLQFLICNQNFHMRDSPDNFSPKDMNNLPNLHYLKLPFPGIQEIRKLNSLQELDGFYVKNEVGYKIGELEHMNELRLLIIKCLENVKNAKEAWNAKLGEKRNLTNLSLLWDDHRSIVDATLDEQVLDNLQPHHSLKNLQIESYVGGRSAIWMNNINLISNLECIELGNCLEWQTLPPFGQLPFLKSLYLRKMPKVKQFDYKFHGKDRHCIFPLLQVLHIEELEELEDWFDAKATTGDCLFPCLTELHLKYCPKLQELPSLPPMLNKLEIDSIGWKTLSWLQGTINCCSISIRELPDVMFLKGLQEVESTGNCNLILSELFIKDPLVLLTEPLRNITSLQKLIIICNEELVSIPNEVEEWFLQVSSSLCELEFLHLKSLQCLPSFLKRLSLLKILHVPKLQLLPNIPNSLEQLELVELESLLSLPSSLESLSSLKILSVKKVPQLQLLPNMPSSLELLRLEELESLKCLPSSLSSTSLKQLELTSIPLKKLPNLPTSLCELWLWHLEYLDCLPSCFDRLSSLQNLYMNVVPQLQELPDLPPSLCKIDLFDLSKLDCLPSCLSNLSSLQELSIIKSPQLRELPDLPLSLKTLSIEDCHQELMDRYQMSTGSDWHKIAHIPSVRVGIEKERKKCTPLHYLICRG